MREENAYILDTDQEELNRLGIQHQVWASEAQKGWRNAKFHAGQTLLDLGSGPGFATQELGYIVGKNGKVIAVDQSKKFIHHLEKIAKIQDLNIETFHTDFDSMKLKPNSIDGMFCRWAMAWIPNPEEILFQVKTSLKTLGKMVIQEYFDWSVHQTVPDYKHLSFAISACLKSFKEQKGEIDIGKKIPSILSEMGMKIQSQRLIAKFAKPVDSTWQWPASFYLSYFPQLVESGYLTKEECYLALNEFKEFEKNKNAAICLPLMTEIVAEKQK